MGSPQEFIMGLSNDPDAFIVVVTYSETADVIATASARRYLGPPADSSSPWARRLDVKEGDVEWELKLMATHPEAQGGGLALRMMELVEKEITGRERKGRVIAARDAEERQVNVKLVLSTPREIMGEYYAQRGFVKDYEVERGEGYSFHIVFMSKVVAVLP